MEMRAWGNTGLEFSALGMGCWAYGGGEYWGEQSQKDVSETVARAVDWGVNYFDTAEAYNAGQSEASLGEALRHVDRSRVVVGTKVSPSNTEPQTLVEHCEASLKRLQTDYVDLYMVHWPITPAAIAHFTDEKICPEVPDAFAALRRLREQGKVRFVGVSNFGVARLDEALGTGAEIVANELPYSLLTRGIEWEILPHCRERGIGVIGYMALLQGVLADIYPTLDDVPVWQRRTRHFDSRKCDEVRHGGPGLEAETNAALEAIRRIGTEHGMSMPEIALKWALAGEGVASTLVGSRGPAELEANVRAAAEPLDPAILEQLNAATDEVKEKLGRGFDYYESLEGDRTV